MSNVEAKKGASPRKNKKDNGAADIDIPDAETPKVEANNFSK